MPVVIDLPADLHFEDDDGNYVVRPADATAPTTVEQGAVLIIGSDHW